MVECDDADKPAFGAHRADHRLGIGRWGVSAKLWLGFGALMLVVVVAGLVSSLYIDEIDRKLRQVVEVEEPLERAVLEMKINAGETARAVLDYVRELETEYLEVMRDSEADFERYAELEETAERWTYKVRLTSAPRLRCASLPSGSCRRRRPAPNRRRCPIPRAFSRQMVQFGREVL
ncbi:MAG: hypothetical protein O7F14_12730 [Alphaproteobacteria bacterium]|nr:hypothetical protein [Alphaproteobacteria bacterium]